eukprot:ANDGO_04574.mRNA.1 [Fructose-bisphosphate aldolase]-lysine N-methyltransferase
MARRVLSGVLVLLVAAVVCGVVSANKGATQTKFTSWLSQHKVAIPNVKFVDFVETGPGAMANADIAADSTIVRVPKSLFLSSGLLSNKTNPELAEAVESIRGLTPQYKLALILLNEAAKGEKSFWAPYIATFPAEYDTSIYFSEEQLEELKGSNLLPLTLARKQQLQQNYDEVFPFLLEKFAKVFSPKAAYSLEKFTWAISTVWKYSFYLKDGEDTVSVLVPLLDRFNHGSVETQFKLAGGDGGDADASSAAEDAVLEVSTKTAFRKGEQVFVSRGPKSNLELVLDYGYALEKNPNDNVALNVRMTGEDKLSKIKSTLLGIAGLEVNATYLLFDSLLSDELLKGLRIQLLRDNELEKFERVTSGKPVSLANELRVHRAILAACNNMLNGYSASLDDDETLLKTSLPIRERSAIVLRRNEKKVIQSVMIEVSKRWRDILLDGFPETDDEIKAVEEAKQQEQLEKTGDQQKQQSQTREIKTEL